jgi:hypothetical protein
MDKIYDDAGSGGCSLGERLQLNAHRLICPRCAAEERALKAAWKLLADQEFFPESPCMAGRIMERVYAEEPAGPGEERDAASGVSFRGWVVTGFIVLISLSTSFFGVEFGRIAASQGSSFLLPVGLTIGCVLTGYGALFIGSHLKAFSLRFLKPPAGSGRLS